VIKDIKKIINHPKLKSETQNRLKSFYRASEEIEKMKDNCKNEDEHYKMDIS
jgi:hypothetical protein